MSTNIIYNEKKYYTIAINSINFPIKLNNHIYQFIKNNIKHFVFWSIITLFVKVHLNINITKT